MQSGIPVQSNPKAEIRSVILRFILNGERWRSVGHSTDHQQDRKWLRFPFIEVHGGKAFDGCCPEYARHPQCDPKGPSQRQPISENHCFAAHYSSFCSATRYQDRSDRRLPWHLSGRLINRTSPGMSCSTRRRLGFNLPTRLETLTKNANSFAYLSFGETPRIHPATRPVSRGEALLFRQVCSYSMQSSETKRIGETHSECSQMGQTYLCMDVGIKGDLV